MTNYNKVASISSNTNSLSSLTTSTSNLDDNTTATVSIDSSYLGSNIGIGTTASGLSWTTPSYATIGYMDAASINNDNLPGLFSFLKEEEIEEIFDKIIERADGKDNDSIVKDSISAIIKKRHFSEDFLMKYFQYTSIEVIMKEHSADIKSQNYTQLALLIEGLK